MPLYFLCYCSAFTPDVLRDFTPYFAKATTTTFVRISNAVQLFEVTPFFPHEPFGLGVAQYSLPIRNHRGHLLKRLNYVMTRLHSVTLFFCYQRQLSSLLSEKNIRGMRSKETDTCFFFIFVSQYNLPLHQKEK